MKVTVQRITPAVARELLKRNVSNRPISKVTVNTYARDMKNGKWEEHGQSIQISETGKLIDGQHRLMALIEAEYTANFVVVEDITESAFATIDTGRLRRTSDVFSCNGVANSVALASIVRCAMGLKRGLIGAFNSGNIEYRVTNQDALTEYRLHSEVYNNAYSLAEKCYKKLNFLTKKEVGGIYAFLVQYKQHSHEIVNRFFMELFFGNENKTITVLRDRLIKDRLSKASLSVGVRMSLIAKTWNAYLANKELKRIQYSDQEGKINFN